MERQNDRQARGVHRAGQVSSRLTRRRDEKAAEYPDDERNRYAALAIRRLAMWLRKHPDDPVATSLKAGLLGLWDDPDTALGKGETMMQEVSRFGFDRNSASVTDAACERFTMTLVDKVEKHLSSRRR